MLSLGISSPVKTLIVFFATESTLIQCGYLGMLPQLMQIHRSMGICCVILLCCQCANSIFAVNAGHNTNWEILSCTYRALGFYQFLKLIFYLQFMSFTRLNNNLCSAQKHLSRDLKLL